MGVTNCSSVSLRPGHPHSGTPMWLHLCKTPMSTLVHRINDRNGAAVMAQKVQTLFVDDLDGSEAEGTVRFGLDGTEYEIDLNAKHARQLRDTLARYAAAGRRLSASARRPARGGRNA